MISLFAVVMMSAMMYSKSCPGLMANSDIRGSDFFFFFFFSFWRFVNMDNQWGIPYRPFVRTSAERGPSITKSTVKPLPAI